MIGRFESSSGSKKSFSKFDESSDQQKSEAEKLKLELKKSDPEKID